MIAGLFGGARGIGAQPQPEGQEPAPGPQDLVVFATSDTDGTLATPRCDQTPILSPDALHYAQLAQTYREVTETASEDGRSFEPIALHLGDSVFPGALGRFLLSQGTSGAESLAGILNQIPYLSHTLGNREIGLRRSKLVALAEGALETGLPLRAANVRCTPKGGAEALCDAIGTGRRGGPYDVVERGDVRILSVSVVDPAIRESIDTTRMSGLEILDPVELLGRLVPSARDTVDPDLVFLQLHTGPGTGVEEIVELTRAVEGIDVVFTEHQLGEASETLGERPNGYVVAPDSGAFIIPTGRSYRHASVSSLRVERSSETGDWSVRDVRSETVDASEATPEPKTAERLWRASEQLCRRWGKPIATNTPLQEAFEREDFIEFVLKVMRVEGKAELAISNDGAFLRSEMYPIRSSLTFYDVNAGLPYENPMVLARVRGEELARVADKLGDEAVAVGLETSGTEVLVNGRPLREDRLYRVALNRYTADGGDEIIEPEALVGRRLYRPDWNNEAPAISELVIRYIQTRNHLRYGSRTNRLSPTENFPDLHYRPLWQFVGSINTSYNRISVNNPEIDGGPAYEQSQLNVQGTRQLNLEGAFEANADSRNHGWDNSLLLQYGTTRTQPEGQLDQTRDLIRAKSLYKYAGLRAQLGGNWWTPMPTAEIQFESEFRPPDRRDQRKAEITGILGSTFELWPPFEVKLGFDVRRDVNDPEDKTRFGLAAAYKLARINLVDVLESPIRFESEFEYFFNDPFVDRIHELRTTSRLFYSVFGNLNVTSSFSTFMFRSGRVDQFGRNTEFNVGLNYLWDASLQTF